jgi:hypothetical protein
MTKQQTKFKKAVAIAKQLRKSNPAMKYTDAIKKAFKSLGSTTHKDTKSHNVNIRVVSGVKKKVGATLLLEKGETPRTKPRSIKTITRKKAGTFKKWKTIGETPDFKDSVAANEIRDYADNNSLLFFSRRLPILKNLYKKWKKGTFKIDLAAKLWLYYINDAMQKYNKQHGSKGDKWHKLLSVSDRKLLAHDYAKNTLHDFENHVYSDYDMK